jgi:surface polysaccharide O-acyltransferase-like enzyme
MSAPAEEAAGRNTGFDALRAALTLLVVFHHTAITYGAIGGWYYHEIPTDRSLAATLLVYFCTVNQAYFMGLFFLLAGYFTPAAIHHKGACRYLADRLIRLLLPLLFYGWIIGPATIALARTSRGRPFTETLLHLWREGTFENGPLWFAQALLLFALAAVIGSYLSRRDHSGPGMPAPARPFPSDIALAWAALGTGAAALALRSVWPVGTNVWGLQLGYFASYVVLFAFGCHAAGSRWLEHLPAARVRTWWRVCRVALPVLPIVYFAGRALPALPGRTLGIVYAFWEPLVAWGAILMLLHRFQRRFARLGTLGKALARRAYTIYIVHPPIVVAVALAWRSVPANALLKFALTGSGSCLLCFVVAGGMLRIPGLRKIL